MYHDGKVYIWIPSSLTLSRLTAESASLINGVHADLNAQNETANQAYGLSLKTDYKTNYAVGEIHEYYFSLNDLYMGGAPFTRDVTPGMAVCGPIENLSYLPLDYVSLIVLFGGDVEGLKVVFRFSDPEAACPLNPEQTWNEWGKGTSSRDEPKQYGEYWYRSSEVDGQGRNDGQAIDASAWVSLMLAGQLTVLTTAQYATITQANQQGPE